MPTGKLQRQYHILNYHCTRESQAKEMTKFMKINGNDNPADIVTKSQVLWRDMDFLKE